jgi:hypothetical protein
MDTLKIKQSKAKCTQQTAFEIKHKQMNSNGLPHKHKQIKKIIPISTSKQAYRMWLLF